MTTEKNVLSQDQIKKRRGRSMAIAISLGLLVALFYLVTIIKLGPGIMDRPL
ncbi:hypothetical protein [Pseudovibrio flavus]|uniref:hypothetical protein n=1 Tax=Pseudovibrio flavus TaxID=2529854 RepID=UPI00211CECA1|nr:hypothetical protein [Pseudovibrio flavus]